MTHQKAVRQPCFIKRWTSKPAIATISTLTIWRLATHRHHGLDIVFITQHPSFLDSFVRRLVQRHMHISIKPVGRKLYEWNECVDQPESSQNIARAIEVNFKLPKEAFGMYKSAEIHTKPKRRLPKSLIFLIFFLPALLGYG